MFASHFQNFLLKVFQLSTKALHMLRRAILATPAHRMVGVCGNIDMYGYIYKQFSRMVQGSSGAVSLLMGLQEGDLRIG
jgi:hypothetical protein